MNEKIQKAFNEQINAEMFSSYLYLSMSAWLESEGFKGMAHWMRMQVQEEDAHAKKFIDFINQRDGRVLLSAIDAPKTEWSDPLEVFKDALEHERKVSALINALVDLSLSEKDHASNSFLQWFVNEQVEEEASAQEIRDNLKLASNKGMALLMIDRELGQRPVPAVASASATDA